MQESSVGDVDGPDRDSRAEQEEEGTAGNGAAGGESQSTRAGLEHPGRSGTQPRLRTSGAGPRNKQAAPWTGTSGGPRSQEEAKAWAASLGEEQEGTQEGPLD